MILSRLSASDDWFRNIQRVCTDIIALKIFDLAAGPFKVALETCIFSVKVGKLFGLKEAGVLLAIDMCKSIRKAKLEIDKFLDEAGVVVSTLVVKHGAAATGEVLAASSSWEGR